MSHYDDEDLEDLTSPDALKRVRLQRCRDGQCCGHADVYKLTPTQWNMLAQCFDGANFNAKVLPDAMAIREFLISVQNTHREELERAEKARQRRVNKKGEVRKGKTNG